MKSFALHSPERIRKILPFSFLLILIGLFLLSPKESEAQCISYYSGATPQVAPLPDSTSSLIMSMPGSVKLSSLLAGYTYTVSTYPQNSYLTVTYGTINGPVLSHGPAPFQFVMPASGNIYLHLFYDYQCTNQNSQRGVTIFCIKPPLDISLNNMVTPTRNHCLTNSDSVIYSIKNLGSQTIDFSTDSVILNAGVTGPNPLSFAAVTINSGTLAPGASQNVVVHTGYDMSFPGLYTFEASVTMTSDGNNLNDTLPAISIPNQPLAIISSDSICPGMSTNLNITGSSGYIQWQESTDGGLTWYNASTSGNDSSFMSVIPTINSDYRAVICGSIITNSVSATIHVPSPPIVSNDTLCGIGNPVLTANGSGTMLWFRSLAETDFLDSGNIYSPTLSATTTFYVASAFGGSTEKVGLSNPMFGAFSGNAVPYQLFDVYNDVLLLGVHVFPQSAGNVIFELRDSSGTIINSATVAVTTENIGNKTFIPLFFNLNPGINYRLGRANGSVNMLRDINPNGFPYPFTLPGLISITGSELGNQYYFYSFDWVVSTSCITSMVPVTAVVDPAVPISTTPAYSHHCGSDTTALTVSSSNSTYNYSWSPSIGLNQSSGNSVIANPSSSTTYFVTATDTAGCVDIDTVEIMITPIPTVQLNIPATVCDSKGVITLNNASPAGGTYSGPGIWLNTFNAGLVGKGIHQIIYEFTDGNGCFSSDTGYIEVIESADFHIGPDTTICAGTYVTLDAGPGFNSYSWSNNSTGQTIQAGVAGTYIATVTDSSGCVVSDSLEIFIKYCAGISEEGNNFSIRILPNPSGGIFTLIINENAPETINIRITDLAGKIVYSATKEKLRNGNNKTLNLEGISKGVYLLNVNFGKSVLTEKLIVQ